MAEPLELDIKHMYWKASRLIVRQAGRSIAYAAMCANVDLVKEHHPGTLSRSNRMCAAGSLDSRWCSVVESFPMRQGEWIMARGKASGYSLTTNDARVVSGMQARGDRDHDIAAWFGVNQGRIAEVKDGKFGTISAAPSHELPPTGPPGVKGRRLRRYVGDALAALVEGDTEKAIAILKEGTKRYDANEA
jgi:hypothetical protein